MKPNTEKPSESPMRFFTPELYRQFNSPNDQEAERADELWEEAIKAYRHHLDTIRDGLPRGAKALAQGSLHDAELLSLGEVPLPLPSVDPYGLSAGIWSLAGSISLKREDHILFLLYFLSEEIQVYPPQPDWPFSRERIHWLYDELDIAGSHLVRSPRTRFLHRILFSNGG